MIVGSRSEPPDLSNFSYEKWLGGGGFADVFLYSQVRPARPVAIKVLRSAARDDEARRAFDDEANLMARVSAHSCIVSVYEAGVAPDGRPYLVMEYYPNPHMGERMRRGGLAVHEVLKVGVQVASAVETAHRVGILHRDIKPANILVSQFNKPGLTDFGIAGERQAGSLAEGQGFTSAYVPHEVLIDASPGDERGDVYSLAATLYALLATRAPFQLATGAKDDQAMLQRTLSSPVPPIGRDDVPQSLELLLVQAMAKDPAHRPQSAESFARALQGIERQLQLAPTEFELVDTTTAHAPGPVRDHDHDHDRDEGTRAARPQVVRQESGLIPPRSKESPPPAVASPLLIAGPPGQAAAREAAPPSLPEAPPLNHTVRRSKLMKQSVPAGESAKAPVTTNRARQLVVAGIGGTVVVSVVVGIILSAGGGDKAAQTTTPSAPVDENALVLPNTPEVPRIQSVSVVEGVAEVSWDAGVVEAGDTYLVRRTDETHAEDPAVSVDGSPARVEGIEPDKRPCFRVTAQRGSRPSAPSEEMCAT